jgi:hypothetical protein
MRSKLTYSAGSLVRTYRAARAWEPDHDFIKIDWCTTLTAREWLRWFRQRLDEKASRGDVRTGRKLDPTWQRDCRNLARDLKRVRVYRSNYPMIARDFHGRIDHCFARYDD